MEPGDADTGDGGAARCWSSPSTRSPEEGGEVFFDSLRANGNEEGVKQEEVDLMYSEREEEKRTGCSLTKTRTQHLGTWDKSHTECTTH